MPPKVITPVAPRSTSLTRAIRLDAAAIRSRTPMLAVAMVFAAPRGERVRPGRDPSGPAPGARLSYSSFFSSSATIEAGSGR